MIDKELLEILACPACRADVKLDGDVIVCVKCGRRYPIKDDIPIMLVEEADMPAENKISCATCHNRRLLSATKGYRVHKYLPGRRKNYIYPTPWS